MQSRLEYSVSPP